MTKQHQPSAILLAAGRSSRMEERVGNTPKCMLSLPTGTRILDRLIQSILPVMREIVLVTGYGHDVVEEYVTKHYGNRVRCVFNKDYVEDTNILSTDIGIRTLHEPEKGYLIVETDLLVSEAAWLKIFEATQQGRSFWVCNGTYSQTLTGGIVKTDFAGNITNVTYQPKYDNKFNGWPKMVGIVYVAPEQVAAHGNFSQVMLLKGLKQYYMTPWVEHLDMLPCVAVKLDGIFSAAFNTADEFDHAIAQFLAHPSN